MNNPNRQPTHPDYYDQPIIDVPDEDTWSELNDIDIPDGNWYNTENDEYISRYTMS